MKKFQLTLIFLMSYNFIKIIECSDESLKEAKLLNNNLAATDPITEKFSAQIAFEVNNKILILDNNTPKFFDGFYNLSNEKMMSVLDKFPDKIDKFYKLFNELLNSGDEVNFAELEKHLTVLLSYHEDSGPSLLADIDMLIGDVYDMLSTSDRLIKDFETRICLKKPVLRQQHVMKFFDVVLNTASKTSNLILSAAEFVTYSKKVNFSGDIEKVIKVSKDFFEDSVDNARFIMNEFTSRDMRSCNSIVDIKKKTYVELTGPSQGFIFESSAFEKNSTCDLFDDKHDKCKPYDPSCFRQSCSADGGILKNCEVIGTKSMAICPSKDPSKRYLSAQSNPQIFGNSTAAKHCPKLYLQGQSNQYLTTSVTLLKPYNKLTQFCYCNCERKRWKKGDVRAISLSWVSADIEKGRVITNLRFEEKNGMILLVPQTGVLLPGGMINQTTLRWSKPYNPEPMIEGDELLYDGERPGDNSFMYVTSGLSINLDDITVPPNHAITGVRLSKVQSPEDGNDNVIELSVSSVLINRKSGLFLTHGPKYTATEFMLNKFRHAKRQVMNLGETNIPTSKPGENTDISVPHQRVEFRQTSKNDDLGQSFVPFIDTRPVNTNLGMALSTISLYHRGCAKSGGFIAFKFHAFDISNYFEQLISSIIFPNPVYI